MATRVIDSNMACSEATAKALKDFLYANRRRASAIRLMDTDWPQSARIRTMLVDYAGLALNEGRRSSVFNAIDRGALAYGKILGQKPDWERLCSFIITAANTLAVELAGVRVTSHKGDVWLPESGSSLLAWIMRETKGEVNRVAPKSGEVERIESAILLYLSSELPCKARSVING